MIHGPLLLPFALRRPVLLLRDLLADRRRPDLERLAMIQEPEQFVWEILPHAARTFSACIILLPSVMALPSAVAYLYCRILDSYEDLLPDTGDRDKALASFVERLEAADSDALPGKASAIDPALARDARDSGHVLLVNRCSLVDRVFITLDAEVRRFIVDLVREMSQGMRWWSETFERQGGCLSDARQLSRYCYAVMGTPILFCVRLFLLSKHGDERVGEELGRDAVAVGEFLQLANVTRDIEKDLRRGIGYHPLLHDALGKDASSDLEVAAKGQAVRGLLLDRALSLAPAYQRMVDGLRFRKMSLARASAVLMLLFTERYYRTCARRTGRAVPGRDKSGLSLLLRSLSTTWSPQAGKRVLQATERDLQLLLQSSATAATSYSQLI